MYHVLVVCTGNICRSPMAAGLLENRLPMDLADHGTVCSAGTHGLHGQLATENAIKAMAEAGFDIRAHRARQLTRELTRRADLIVAMEKVHLKEIKRVHGWSKPNARLLGEFGLPAGEQEIEDPIGQPLHAYQTCLQRLRPCIDGLIEWLNDHISSDESKP
jgi:protein-tyrosine-phosphatase